MTSCVATLYFSALDPELGANTLRHHGRLLAYSDSSSTVNASSGRPAGTQRSPGTVTGRAGPNRAGPGLTLAPRPRRCHGNAPAPRPAAHLRPPPPSSRSA